MCLQVDACDDDTPHTSNSSSDNLSDSDMPPVQNVGNFIPDNFVAQLVLDAFSYYISGTIYKIRKRL